MHERARVCTCTFVCVHVCVYDISKSHLISSVCLFVCLDFRVYQPL